MLNLNLELPPVPEPIAKAAATPIEIYVDGACQPNPGAMHIGLVVKHDGEIIWKHNSKAGEGTNNQAEFAALLQGLKAFAKISQDFPQYNKVCTIYTDSQLVARCWKEKRMPTQAGSAYYFKEAMLVLNTIKTPVYLEWIDRNQNQAADGISRPVSTFKSDSPWKE